MAFKVIEQGKKESETEGKFKILEPAKEAPIGMQRARGITQGALDVTAMGLGAPFFPVEMALKGGVKLAHQALADQAKFFGAKVQPLPEGQTIQQPEQEIGEAQENKFTKQQDILQRVQKGHMPTWDELQELSDEYVSHGGSTMFGSISEVGNAIPEGGLEQEIFRRGTRTAPLFAINPALGVSALASETAGLTGKEVVKALGGSEGMQTAADLIAGIGTAAYNPQKYIKAAQEIPYIAGNPSLMSKIEAASSPSTIQKRLFSLGSNVIENAEQRMNAISQEALGDFGNFSAREMDNIVASANRNTVLGEVSSRDMLPQQAWTGIQEGINIQFAAEKNLYTPLYTEVSNEAKKIKVVPKNSMNMAGQLLNKLESLQTSPIGYSQTAKLVKDVITDLGGNAPSEERIAKALGNKDAEFFNEFFKNAPGNVVFKNKENSISADKLQNLAIRLNEAINYETLTSSVKDWLKPLQKAVKQEFRNALKEKSPSTLAKFNQAENLYQNTARRFNEDIIQTIRSSSVPEMLINDMLKPSNFENLVNTLGRQSKYVEDAERQIVDAIGRMGQKEATETLKNFGQHLSPNARSAAQKLIDVGDKLTPSGQQRIFEGNILENVNNAIVQGTRPDFTLHAMRTPQGYAIVKNTLGRTEQGKKLFKVMERQVVQDMFNSIVKEGQIDWQKAIKILDDPGYAQVMENIMGIDGVQFIRNIEQWSNNINTNLMSLKSQNPAMYQKLYNAFDGSGKIALSAFLGSQFGVIAGVGSIAAAIGLKRFGAALITSPRTRKVIRNFRGPISPAVITHSANVINEATQGID